MKGDTGTNTGVIYRRPPQKGNRRCKECSHLQYGVRVVKGEQYNYYCDVNNTPRHYTKKCYCSHFKKKQ